MKKKFRDLLHAYKVEAHKITHTSLQSDPAVEAEIRKFTEQALNQAFDYHFHKEPSPERLETFTMIKNYTLEALMPRVIEKVMARVISLEKQHAAMVKLLDGVLETLSEDEQAETRA